MEDETSNDTEAVEYIDSQSDDGETRPIMLLLRRLINHKQNTVMTNAQIIDILQKELNINVNTMHVLEVDIYIKIVKKFLKDWPQWEDLEHISNKLHKVNDYDAITNVLNKKYKNLKEYLSVMLEAAKPLAKSAVAKVENASTSTEEMADNIDSDVVMEIQCTRNQLNHLFFRRPRLDLNTTVFNMAKIEPSRISLKQLPFEAILNCWAMKISVNLPYFTCTRELMYEFKHVLINKARNEKPSQDIQLNTCLQMNQFKYLFSNFKQEETKIDVIHVIDEIMKKHKHYEFYDDSIKPIFEILKKDLEVFPKSFKAQSKYRRYANDYKYVRYLFVENERNYNKSYDLQLEETLSPVYTYHLQKFVNLRYVFNENDSPIEDWLKIECVMCKLKFACSSNLRSEVEQHFADMHYNEPPWQCTHCKNMFSLDYLAKNYWKHEC